LNGATGVGFTTVFMMYFSDLFAYAATLSILLYRNFGPSEMSFLFFFQVLSIIVSCVGVLVLGFATIFFWIRLRNIPHLTHQHHSTWKIKKIGAGEYTNVLPDGVLVEKQEDEIEQIELEEKTQVG